MRVGSRSRQSGRRRENRIASRKRQGVATAVRTPFRRAINVRHIGLSVEHLPKSCREFIRQARFRKKGCETGALRTFPQGSLNAAHRNNGNIACAGRSVSDRGETATRRGSASADPSRYVRVYLSRMAKGFSIICDRDDLETRRRKRKGIQRARVSSCPSTMSTSGRVGGCRGRRRSMGRMLCKSSAVRFLQRDT
jgi:hypothetical protein